MARDAEIDQEPTEVRLGAKGGKKPATMGIGPAPAPEAPPAAVPPATTTSATDALPDDLTTLIKDVTPEESKPRKTRRYFAALKPTAPLFELVVGSSTPGVEASVTFRKETFVWAGPTGEDQFRHYGLQVDLTDEEARAVIDALGKIRFRLTRNAEGRATGVQVVTPSAVLRSKHGDLSAKHFVEFRVAVEGEGRRSLADAPGGAQLLSERDLHLAMAGEVDAILQESPTATPEAVEREAARRATGLLAGVRRGGEDGVVGFVGFGSDTPAPAWAQTPMSFPGG